MNVKKNDDILPKLISDFDFHLDRVYKDEEFIAVMDEYEIYERENLKNPEKIYEVRQLIAKEYAIREMDVSHFLVARILLGLGPMTSSAKAQWNPEQNKWYIEFALNTPRAEVMEAFDSLASYRKFMSQKPTKRKTLDYPDIVYKVFRLIRKNNDWDNKDYNWNKLYQEFTNPNSDYYDDKASSFFATPIELRTYYNKHKPE